MRTRARPRELELVALRRDLPESGLRAGQIGTVVLVHKQMRSRSSLWMPAVIPSQSRWKHQSSWFQSAGLISSRKTGLPASSKSTSRAVCPWRYLNLITGCSLWKTESIAEMRRRGHAAFDMDEPGWSQARPGMTADGEPFEEMVWREDRVRELLAQEQEVLFVGGCASNQGAVLLRVRPHSAADGPGRGDSGAAGVSHEQPFRQAAGGAGARPRETRRWSSRCCGSGRRWRLTRARHSRRWWPACWRSAPGPPSSRTFGRLSKHFPSGGDATHLTRLPEFS